MPQLTKTQRIKALNKVYSNACNELVKEFEAKQSIKFDYWVGNFVGGTASFNDEYFFSIQDVVLDLTEKIPKGMILDWQNTELQKAMSPDYISESYRVFTLEFRLKFNTKSDGK